MTYKECVDYVLSVPLFAKKLGIGNLNQILELMNHPECSYPVVHIAGTNGKGSTCLFLASILQKKGKKVGIFTSPHLIRINERIRVGEHIISDEEFVSVFEETMQYVKMAEQRGIAHPSFFELVFLMAVCYFQKCDVDYAIFEAGMGGRLDATNVLKPELCIITSVGLDHMQYLGSTLSEIAGEKAGIIKTGTPVLFFDRKDEAADVIMDYAGNLGTEIHAVEKSQYKILKITEKTIDFSFNSVYYRYYSLSIRKTGIYQIENAILAVRAYELLLTKDRYSLGENNSVSVSGLLHEKIGTDLNRIQAGLYDMVWMGRMQQISEHVYIDGAHNEEAVEAFCHTLEVLFPKEQKILLFAVSKDKDYKHMIERLCRISFTEVILVRYKGDRAADLNTVEDAFRRFSDSRITAFDDMKVGFTYGKSHVGDQYLFCVGSLYLVGGLLGLGV